jgi:hypothetical protein
MTIQKTRPKTSTKVTRPKVKATAICGNCQSYVLMARKCSECHAPLNIMVRTIMDSREG